MLIPKKKTLHIDVSEDTKRMMEYAKNKYGIRPAAFLRNHFWEVPEEKREKAFCKYLQDRKRLKATCLVRLTDTGISHVEAARRLAQTKRELGISAMNYLIFEFYNIPQEEQRKAYISLLDAKKIYRGDRLRLEYAILRVVEATGWDCAKTKAAIEKAQSDFGITPTEYVLDKFYVMEEADKPAYVERILRERELQAASEEADAKLRREEKAEYLDYIMKNTGWSLKETKQQIAATNVRSGAFANFRFWELSEAERATYFTTTQSKVVIERFASQQRYQRDIMFHKELFYKEYEEYLHRKWLSTAGMDFETFRKTFAGEGKIIFKPRAGLGGRGIRVFEISDEASLKTAFEEITTLSFGTIETFLTQHPKMQQLSANSVNTIRIVTIRTNDPAKKIETGKVHFIYAAIRMSIADSHVDNLHSGGAAASLDIHTGKVLTPAVNYEHEVYDVHPVTGVNILGFEVPFFAEAKAMIEEAMLTHDLEGYYGWDIAFTKDGPVFIENNNNPGTGLLQLPYVPQKKGMRYVFEEYLK